MSLEPGPTSEAAIESIRGALQRGYTLEAKVARAESINNHILGPREFGDCHTCTVCGRAAVKQPNGDWAGSALNHECGDVIDRKAAMAALTAMEAMRHG